MGGRMTAALCVLIVVSVCPVTRAGAAVRLTIKDVATIRPPHDGRYFARASIKQYVVGIETDKNQ